MKKISLNFMIVALAAFVLIGSQSEVFRSNLDKKIDRVSKTAKRFFKGAKKRGVQKEAVRLAKKEIRRCVGTGCALRWRAKVRKTLKQTKRAVRDVKATAQGFYNEEPGKKKKRTK